MTPLLSPPHSVVPVSQFEFIPSHTHTLNVNSARQQQLWEFSHWERYQSNSFDVAESNEP